MIILVRSLANALFVIKDSNRNSLTGHMNECTICYEEFNQKHSLTWCMYERTDEKPYKCTICYKGFNHKVQSQSLTGPTKEHTGE